MRARLRKGSAIPTVRRLLDRPTELVIGPATDLGFYPRSALMVRKSTESRLAWPPRRRTMTTARLNRCVSRRFDFCLCRITAANNLVVYITHLAFVRMQE